MFNFIDTKNRTWDVTLSLAAARRIDASDFGGLKPEGFCFLNPDEQLVRTMVFQTAPMFAAIWATIEPQALAAGVTVEQWEEGLDGTVIEKAKEAWWGSLQHFFPDLATSLSTSIHAYRTGIKTLNKRLEASTPEIHRSIEKLAEREIGELLGKVERYATGGERSGSVPVL